MYYVELLLQIWNLTLKGCTISIFLLFYFLSVSKVFLFSHKPLHVSFDLGESKNDIALEIIKNPMD